MRYPKSWNKMNLSEQEDWLVKKYQETIEVVDEIRRMLAKVRGGQKIKVIEIDRPDEAALKN